MTVLLSHVTFLQDLNKNLSILNLHLRREKKAHKHKLFALVNVQMALGQMAGCPRVNRAKKFMCSPRNTGKINYSLWLTSRLSQGCPDFQKVYVFKVYVPFLARSSPALRSRLAGVQFGYSSCLERFKCLRFSVSMVRQGQGAFCMSVKL